MSHLNPTHLQAFVAVVDTGSFTQAAHHLHRTQSAISAQIRKLEQSVGRRLLERQTRSNTLTEEGELFLGYARQILDLQEAARSALNVPVITSTVRVGIPDDYAHRYFPEILARFSRLNPQVQLEIFSGLSRTLLDRFDAGLLDVALLTKQPDRSGGEVVRREQLVWAAARQHSAYLRDPVPLALFPEGCVFRTCAIDALNGSGHNWIAKYCSQGYASGEIAVDCGQAITVTLASIVPARWRILDSGDGFPGLPEIEIELYRRPIKDHPAAQQLGAYMAEQLPKI